MRVRNMVEMLAFGEPGEVRYVEFDAPDESSQDALLEMTFYWGQNDFQPQQHPSVSMGDVIWCNGVRHLVLPFGMCELTDNELVTYRAMDRMQRLDFVDRRRS